MRSTDLGARLAVLGLADDGRLEVEIASWNIDSLTGEIGGFAAILEITQPEAVRARLAHIGAALQATYAGAGT